MAEGGEPDDQRNQFSFQNFLKSSELESGKNEGNDVNNSRSEASFKPDLGLQPRREIFKAEEGPKREENPFSFRQFLKKDSNSSTKSECHNQYYKKETKRSSLRGLHTAPDFASGLPDFVQDHFVLENNVFCENSDSKDQREQFCDPNSPPDFAISSNLSDGHHHYPPHSNCDSMTCHSKKPLPKGSQDDLLFNVSCKPKNIRRSAIPQTDSAITSSLPDFLSDGPMLSNHNAIRNDDKTACRPSSCTEVERRQNEDLVLEIVKLRSDNDNLTHRLGELQKLLMLESQKVSELTNDMYNLRKKERDETIALEKMAQQVECNLQTTIERAVTAENTILKLKQELKISQDQVSLLTEENNALRSGDYKLVGIKEKTRLISDQISVAAGNAEQQLRQLLSGVDSLRMLAACLLDIEKVTEDPITTKDSSNS